MVKSPPPRVSMFSSTTPGNAAPAELSEIPVWCIGNTENPPESIAPVVPAVISARVPHGTG